MKRIQVIFIKNWSSLTLKEPESNRPQSRNLFLSFQGKIQEDVIYGVCLPATGFSALFVLLALMTVVSVIVSAFICYHRQLAKVAEEAAPEPTGRRMAAAPPGGTTSRNLSSLGSTFNGSVTFNQWMPSLGQARGKNPGGLLGFPELTHHTGFADMERDCRRNRSCH